MKRKLDPQIVRLWAWGVIAVLYAIAALLFASVLGQQREVRYSGLYQYEDSASRWEPEYSVNEASPWPLHLPPEKEDF